MHPYGTLLSALLGAVLLTCSSAGVTPNEISLLLISCHHLETVDLHVHPFACVAESILQDSSEADFLAPMPHILAMSVNPDTALRDRSCAECEHSPMGISCCGLCAFWVRTGLIPGCHSCHLELSCWARLPEKAGLTTQENPLSQAAGGAEAFEGQCNAHDVAQLLVELKAQGIDLESLRPHELFESIRGRTLW